MSPRLILASIVGACVVSALPAQTPFHAVSKQVNQRLIKIYGSGGFRGLAAYGTGIVISPDGYVLTVAGHLLDTPELKIHLHDGRRATARVVVVEPGLDAALLKIDKIDNLPYFDFAAAARTPRAEPGDWVLAMSNQFEIATRDEPLSVQRGVVAAYSKLHLIRGIYDAPYQGDVYVLDAITNNPGAAGGALTTQSGELLGVIGKELKNGLSNTWVNYAVPVGATVEVRQGEQTVTLNLAEFVAKGMRGEYKPTIKEKSAEGPGGYHGIVLVPNVVERTPPYVEDLVPASPAAKSGLKPDDLIVYVDGEPVVSIATFKEIMSKTRPGMTVRLDVRRGEKLVPIELTLGEMPKRK